MLLGCTVGTGPVVPRVALLIPGPKGPKTKGDSPPMSPYCSTITLLGASAPRASGAVGSARHLIPPAPAGTYQWWQNGSGLLLCSSALPGWHQW